MEKYYVAEEVASKLKISVQTLNLWYRFKRENPEDELAKLLPEYSKNTTTSTRYWTRENIKEIKEFMKKKKYGAISSTSQKYRIRKD